MKEPRLIEGGLVVDDRGVFGFVNGFDFSKIKRFYLVANHKVGFVRAWHAHKKESKYVVAVKGSALVGAVKIDNWSKPSRDAKVWRYVLAENKPAVLYIPFGYANGFMGLTKDAKLMFFSDQTLEKSRADDFRFDARYWDPWQVAER